MNVAEADICAYSRLLLMLSLQCRSGGVTAIGDFHGVFLLPIAKLRSRDLRLHRFTEPLPKGLPNRKLLYRASPMVDIVD
jgi:hypothetical protein